MAFTPRQDAARFYNDNGGEATSTAVAAQNTNLVIPDGADVFYHLRIGVQETSGTGGALNPWKLQYSKNGGAYTDVTTTSTNVKAFGSANLATNGVTTQRLTGLTGTFQAGEWTETGVTPNFNISGSNNSEAMFTIQVVNADTAPGDTLDFHILYNGAVLAGGYNFTPRITISAPLTIASDNSLSTTTSPTLTPKTALTVGSANSATQADSAVLSPKTALTVQTGISATLTATTEVSLDFVNGVYTYLGITQVSLVAFPNYAYVRTGSMSVTDSDGSIDTFVANTPPINGYGLHNYGALTNSYLQSQAFDTASWTKNAAGMSVSANAATAPDGTTTADKIISSAASEAPAVYQGNSASGETIMFFAKAAGYNFANIQSANAGASRVNFNLTNGTVTDTTGVTNGYFTNPFIESLGSGWYRYGATPTGLATRPQTGPVPTATSGPSYTGDGVSGIYLWQGSRFAATNLPSGGPILPTTTATVSIGAAVLSVACPNGTYNATYTFDDNSTQTISTVVTGNTYTVPTYPATLNRARIKKVVLVGDIGLNAPSPFAAVSLTQVDNVTVSPKTALTLQTTNSLTQAGGVTITPRTVLTVANDNSAAQAGTVTLANLRYALLVSTAISTTLADLPSLVGHVLVFTKVGVDSTTYSSLAVNPGTIIYKGDFYTEALI